MKRSRRKIDEFNSIGDDLTMNETARVCPWQHAWFLDNWIRRLIHNPEKIVGKYIEKGQTILDLGCGPGMFSLFMARMVGEEGKVISMDIQEEMLQILRRKSEEAGLDSRILLHKSRPDRIGLREKADFALAFYMVHEVPDKAGFLSEVATLVKPLGRVLIVEPKLHVSKSSFEETVEVAQSTGLRLISRPKVLFSRTVLLQRV
ncbi:tRNA (adenine(57)-N(1)/adenine(58)-N(1))-methyltransferase TrmI [uncultured archaeon]|nr:tRNA (adenine(57)-N(1)/adenine(58)-N(1))-methyltransferase TrmI [uncultured archaeon]